MKGIAVFLPLLVVVPSYLSDNSEEIEEQNYYIYNVTSYYCIHNKPGVFRCGKYNKFVKDVDENYIILKNSALNSCSTVKKDLRNVRDIEQVNVTFCESSEQIDSLENTITISVHDISCRYTYEKFSNGNFDLWVTDSCLESFQIEKKKKKRESVKDESKTTCKNFTSPLKFSSVDACEIVEPLINSTLKYYILNDTRNIKQDSNRPESWYIYKNMLGFTVYYDVHKHDPTCTTDQQYGRLLYKCKCNMIPNQNQICNATLIYGLRISKVYNTNNKFSHVAKFLNSTNRCSYTQKLDEGYEKKDNTALVIVTRKYGELILQTNEELCGKNIWLSKNGFIVSKTMLDTLEPDFDTAVGYDHTGDDLEKIVSAQEKQISDIKALLFYLTILLIVCVLWYVFNTCINLFSLRKLRRRIAKNKLYLMNCVSQSLTSRYLYFNSGDNLNNEVVKVPKNDELYEYIEN
ncbi:uncharacterized protein LOC108908483 [Anoplophora glabripennis]|uniref:uncharacterized protein LOC108908483 n=1 Tax=Anoplophora glabripennis TaxID=217634 RepID=UPI0008759E15|nr:uncharacterized protein LOC108908483 [Anoplophora glabripennis]